MTLPFCLPSMSVERARKLPSSEGGSVGFTVQRRRVPFVSVRHGPPELHPHHGASRASGWIRSASMSESDLLNRPSSIRVLCTLLGRGGLPDEFTIM